MYNLKINCFFQRNVRREGIIGTVDLGEHTDFVLKFAMEPVLNPSSEEKTDARDRF